MLPTSPNNGGNWEDGFLKKTLVKQVSLTKRKGGKVMDKEITCPECGSKEISKGKLDGYVALRPADKLWSTGSPMMAEVCTDCGLIINIRVTKPEKFKKK